MQEFVMSAPTAPEVGDDRFHCTPNTREIIEIIVVLSYLSFTIFTSRPTKEDELRFMRSIW